MAKPKKSNLAKAMSHTMAVQDRPIEATDFDTGAGDIEGGIYYPATPRVIDFAAAARQPHLDDRDSDDEGHVLTPKQIRARARRAARRGQKLPKEVSEQLWKPVEEWDMEELARGRPRAADGSFRGRKPAYVTRELHETAMSNFKDLVRAEMNGHTVDALTVLHQVLGNEEVDKKGRPIVAWSTKVDAAKWMVEHVLGKAVQPTTTDISAKLQLILGAAMVNPAEVDMPAELEGYRPAHIGHRVEQVDADEEDDDIEDAEVVEW